MNYANRGKALEKQVNKLIKFYDSLGLHAQQNNPEQLFDGTFVKNHGFDYQILYKGILYAFDAKNCESKTISGDNFKPHQVNAMEKVKSHGGKGFFLVYFALEKKLVVIDSGVALSKKSFSSEDGQEVVLNFLHLDKYGKQTKKTLI